MRWKHLCGVKSYPFFGEYKVDVELKKKKKSLVKSTTSKVATLGFTWSALSCNLDCMGPAGSTSQALLFGSRLN